jgi:hypothetical protein
MQDKKILSWQALMLMTFTSVWSFANVVNGYANHGLHVVVSWLLLFVFILFPTPLW